MFRLVAEVGGFGSFLLFFVQTSLLYYLWKTKAGSVDSVYDFPLPSTFLFCYEPYFCRFSDGFFLLAMAGSNPSCDFILLYMIPFSFLV